MKAENNVTIPNNLPPSLSVFVDRAHEIDRVERMLADPGVNIITISGPAGIGKTVFATAVARQQIQNRRFPGGVVWLDCDISNTLSNILAGIADVVGIESASSALSALRVKVLHHLRTVPTLLIFDGYETVVEDDEVLSFVGRLPRSTKALILTRKSVQIPGREISLRLAPFNEEVALELWRRYLSPERWEETDRETLREIHRWTGGLPLAIGLVGSLIEQGWPLPGILGQLQEGAVPTERVVERVLNQIEATLTEKQRRFLQALSTFAHPVEGTTIAAVAGMENWRLSAEALARRAVVEFTDGRYVLHPLVRAFFQSRIAPERLEVLQQRMVQYYLTYIEAFEYNFDQIDREWPNIQYTVETTHRSQSWQLFIEFVLRLGQFLTARGYENEHRKWLRQALEATDKLDANTRAALLHNLGVQYQQSGDLDGAAELYVQSLALKEATGDLLAQSATLTNIGLVYRSRGDISSAISYYEQALAISREIGDRLGEANALGNLGASYADLGEYHRAITYYEQALALGREFGDRRGEANALGNLGAGYANLGEYHRAITYYEQALAISREIGDRRGEANALGNLGASYADLGEYHRAITYYEQALAISREIGDRRGEANAFGNLGASYADLGEYHRAITYYEQALAISREIGDRRGEANALGNLGASYADLGKYHRAITYYEQALALGREFGDRRGEANALGNLGAGYTNLGEYHRAITYYEQALAISREIGDRRGEARLYANLGTIYSNLYSATSDLSNLHRALDSYSQALETFRPDEFPLEYAALQNNIANIYANLQTGDRSENIERAIAHYQEALRIRTPESFPLDWAATQNNLAIALSQRLRGDRTGNLGQAIASYEQALRVYTREDFPYDWLRVTTNLSITYAEIGDWPKAKAQAAAVLQSFQSTTLDFESLEAILPWYQHLGELAMQNDDTEFATRVFAEAAYRFELQGEEVPDAIRSKLVEFREQLGDDRFVLIWAEAQRVLTPVLAQTLQEAREMMGQERFGEAADRLSNALVLISETDEIRELKRQKATILFLRGFCLREQELWEDALEDQEKSFQLFEELRDYVGEAHTLLEIGHLFEVMNNYEDARLHYMDAYRLYRRAEDRHGMALASENLGRLEYRVRMFSQAVQDLEEARRLYISVGDRTKAVTLLD